MRTISRLVYGGRGSLAPSHIGFPGLYADAAEKEQGFGQQQYRDWADERETLLELIDEAEYDLLPARGFAAPEHGLVSSSLRATYARVARLERLMADHPEWQPTP